MYAAGPKGIVSKTVYDGQVTQLLWFHTKDQGFRLKKLGVE